MKSMYTLHADYQDLFAQLNDMSKQENPDPDEMNALFAKIDTVSNDINLKAQNYLYFFRNASAENAEIEARMEAFKKEYERLGALLKQRKASIEEMEQRLISVIDNTQQADKKGIKRLDLGIDGKLSIGTSESVNDPPKDFDYASHPEILLAQTPKIDKKKAKELLASGVEIKGLSIQTNKFLRWK
jgi:hypothetical protein